MNHLSRTTWRALASLTFGILFGCAAIGSLLVTNAPPFFVPHLLATAVALAPAMLVAFITAAFWKPARAGLPVMLFLGGFTVPVDMAFLCLNGLFSEETLRMLIAGLLVCAAAWVSVPVAGARGRCLPMGDRHMANHARIEPVISNEQGWRVEA